MTDNETRRNLVESYYYGGKSKQTDTHTPGADQAAAKAFAEVMDFLLGEGDVRVKQEKVRNLARAYLALQQENADWQKRVGALCDANSNLVRGHEAQQQELTELRRALEQIKREGTTAIADATAGRVFYSRTDAALIARAALARKETP